MTQTELYLACKYFLREELTEKHWRSQLPSMIRLAEFKTTKDKRNTFASRYYRKVLVKAVEDLNNFGSIAFDNK